MRKLAWLVILLALCGVGWMYWKSLPKPGAKLEIRRTVLGSELLITGASFDERQNTLRLDGHWEGAPPSDRYLVRTTISDTANGPASGGMFWYSGASTGGPGSRFRLEFPSLPSTATQLFAHIYFADKNDSFTLAAETAFELSNIALQKPKGYVAAPLPQMKEAGGLSVSLLDLRSGGNFAPPGRTPQWFTAASFSLIDKAHSADQWRMMELKITPDTGASFGTTQGIPPTVGGRVVAPVTGTLWKDDGPFQLEATFFRIDDSANDRQRFEAVPLPDPANVSQLSRTWTVAGVTVDFLGIYGKGALLPKGLDAWIADTNILVFTVKSDQDAWIKLSRITFSGLERKVDEMRRIDNHGGVYAISLGDFVAGSTLDLEFVLLSDSRRFTFVAEPSAAN